MQSANSGRTSYHKVRRVCVFRAIEAQKMKDAQIAKTHPNRVWDNISEEIRQECNCAQEIAEKILEDV